MRTLETVLSLANLLAFLALVAPVPKAIGWIRRFVPAALLIAGIQVLAEGYRWQMVPAYVLAGLFFLVWLLQNVAPSLVGGLATHRLSIGLAIGLGILWLAASMVLPMMIPVFHFPRPAGPYEIGTLTYHWVDEDRAEIFTAEPDDRRELMVQIWYPAQGGAALPRAPYLPDADAVVSALARVYHYPAFLFGNLKYVTSNAIISAPVSDEEPSYPVLIFLEGASGFRQMNTFQVEKLVSQGYIVAAIDQPYAAAAVVFPDGREVAVLPIEELQPLIRQSYIPAEPAPVLNGQPLRDGIIPYLAQDAIFTLNQLTALNEADPSGILTGRLDVEHAGTFGMSLGGIVVGEACMVEPRLLACLMMDAPMPTSVVHEGLRQPSMWITRDAETMRLERRRAGGWSEEEIVAHQTSMRAVYESLPGDGYFVQVPGMFHINLTDVPSWSPLVRLLGLAGPINVQRAYSIINAYSLAFFDRHLKGLPAGLLDGPSEEYPEVLFQSRRP